MHKFSSSDSFPKRCPIVSSIGTLNYKITLFLCDLLSSLTPNDYSCKDTFSFVSQIKNANLSGKFLVSYDASSLFTFKCFTAFSYKITVFRLISTGSQISGVL